MRQELTPQAPLVAQVDTDKLLPHPLDRIRAGFHDRLNFRGNSKGYAGFLQILHDPRHPEHAHMLEWAGGSFDPAAFDVATVNQYLASIKA